MMVPARSTIDLTVVLVSYNMMRELPRTLRSLAPDYQIDSDAFSYEVLLVDNGSTQPFEAEALMRLNPHLRILRFATPSVSPVDALNHGIAEAAGRIICACIDGARMASPRLLATALEATSLTKRAVVGTISFHLGLLPQNDSIHQGYDQATEDALLKTVDWQADGYRLFTIASLDPSSRHGLFTCPIETNALFLSRDLWVEVGGFEPRFRSKGGGLANLDLWKRLCGDQRNRVFVLLGEGTFHQVHGGVATNATVSPWQAFDAEYAAIRGQSFAHVPSTPTLIGRLHKSCQAFLARQDATPVQPAPADGRWFDRLRRAVRR